MTQAPIVIYDLETGGLADDAPIIQSSIKLIIDNRVSVSTQLHGLPKGYTQDIEAVETHGYTDADLAGLPLFQESKNYDVLLYHLADASCFVVGHNITGFDNGFLERDGVEINARIIDTLKVMRRTTRDSMDSYRLSYLHAYKKQTGDESFIALDGNAHDAEFDVAVCWELLSDRMSHGLTLDRMVEMSSQVAYLGKLGFGKYGKHGLFAFKSYWKGNPDKGIIIRDYKRKETV